MPDFDSSFSVESLSAIVDSIIDGHFDVIEERPRISTGADRIELDHFLRGREKHLAAMSRKVLYGRFTFSPFLEREIPKPESKDTRTISIASIRDSVVQRALYQNVYPSVDARLSASVFGYRRGRSAHDAVRAIKRHFADGRIFVFDADLRKFFDTLDHEVLLSQVSTLGLDDRAVTLIRRFLKTGKIPATQVEEHRSATGKQKKYLPEARIIGVPQGGVLSGLLSNLYLAGFDAEIRQQHDGYVRYADDFLVCCASEDECRQVHALAEASLTPLKVALHPDKTKTCVSGESGVDFLGFRISTRGVRVRGRNVAKFKTRIKDVLATQKIKDTAERTLRSLIWRLSYKIRGPDEEQIRKMAERGKRISLCRRSWIGYFRIVDDVGQIRRLDRWLRAQVSRFMAEKHRQRVTLGVMQSYGLPSLVNCLWKARAAPVEATADE